MFSALNLISLAHGMNKRLNRLYHVFGGNLVGMAFDLTWHVTFLHLESTANLSVRLNVYR